MGWGAVLLASFRQLPPGWVRYGWVGEARECLPKGKGGRRWECRGVRRALQSFFLLASPASLEPGPCRESSVLLLIFEDGNPLLELLGTNCPGQPRVVPCIVVPVIRWVVVGGSCDGGGGVEFRLSARSVDDDDERGDIVNRCCGRRGV